MNFATWGGKTYLVAAYTCTPLVIIPLEDLKDGAHIRGKTVAELGYGNTPADMIAYTKTDQGKAEDFLLLVNFNRIERHPSLST
jgi:NADPH-dependent glutamate synthase beta subunit-like oxidoreductase